MKKHNALAVYVIFSSLILAVGLQAEPLLPETPNRQPAPKKASEKVSEVKKATPKAPQASLEEREKDETENYLYLLKDANARLQYLRANGEADCAECIAATAGTSNSTLDTPDKARVCIQTWERFYSKDVVDLTIVFGYADSDVDEVASDVLQRKAMVQQITMNCPIEKNDFVRACGFKRSPDFEDIFEKEVPGPSGKNHLVRLRLTASSYSASDRVNRKVAEQKSQSERAESAFYEGLSESAMVVYVGHARGGGGPSFRAALRKKNGTIDYDTYREKKPGLEKLTQALVQTKKTAPLVALLACESSDWERRLTTSAPKSGVLLSGTPNIPMEVALAQAYSLLDSILWQRCEEAFNKALNRLGKYDGQSIVPLKVKQFFHPDRDQY